MDRIQDFYKNNEEYQAKEKERIEAEKQKAAKLDYQERQRLFLDQIKMDIISILKSSQMIQN